MAVMILIQIGWWASVALAIIAAASLVLGAILPSVPSLRIYLLRHRLSSLVGFSAGIMFAIAVHELIPESLEYNPEHAMMGVAGGFLILYVVERSVHFYACRRGHHHHHHHAGHMHHFDTMASAGMAIHNLADGLTLAAAFAVKPVVGGMMVLAIVLHQSAIGVSLGAIMLKAGRARRHILWASSVVASFIVLGAIFYHFVVPVGESTRGIVLGLAAGSFLYVATCDLLPHAHAEDRGWAITTSTLSGYFFVLLMMKFAVGI